MRHLARQHASRNNIPEGGKSQRAEDPQEGLRSRRVFLECFMFCFVLFSYVLGKANMSSGPDRVVLLSRCLVGPRGATSMNTQAGCSKYASLLSPVWVVCTLLLQLSMHCCWHVTGRDLPTGQLLRGLATTKMENQMCRGPPHKAGLTLMERWYLLRLPHVCVAVDEVDALALEHPGKCKPRSATACDFPRSTLQSANGCYLCWTWRYLGETIL